TLLVLAASAAHATPGKSNGHGSGGSKGSREFRGRLTADGSAVDAATVRLMAAGKTPANARELGTATTDEAGAFVLAVPPNVNKGDVLYATASGGSIGSHDLSADVELATALADLRSGTIVVDELTTVAAGYSLAQFAHGGALGGPNPGLQNAATMPRN